MIERLLVAQMNKKSREGFSRSALQQFEMTETSHTDFEIAIERELHGALAPRQADELGAHLAGCGECRAYQRAAMEMEANMEAVGTLYSKEVEWGKLRGRVVDQQENLRMSTSVLLAYIAVVALFGALSGGPHDVLAGVVMGLGLGAPLLWLLWHRRALARDAQRDSLSGLYDTLLVENRRQRRLRLAVIVVFCALSAISLIDAVTKGHGADWLILGMCALNIMVSIHRLVVLRRERAALAPK